MMKLKRVHQSVAPGDGRRLLVDRIWSWGVRKEALIIDALVKEAGPGVELRKWFGHDPSRWAGLRQRYRHELEAYLEVLERLLGAARQSDITLGNGARDNRHNQAVVIKDFLEFLTRIPNRICQARRGFACRAAWKGLNRDG